MAKSSFEQVWRRIVSLEGKEFRTITNLPFTYELKGNSLRPSRTEYNISKKDFAKAYELVPIASPGEIRDIVRGPAYVWSILHDERIYNSEW